MKFESCNHCGLPGAYVSYMFVECSNPMCDQYTFRQSSAYQAHLDDLAARAMEKAAKALEPQKEDGKPDTDPRLHTWSKPVLFDFNRGPFGAPGNTP